MARASGERARRSQGEDESNPFGWDLTSQRFDWREGTFRNEDDVSLGLKLLLHLVICMALLIASLAIYAKGLVDTPYPLLAIEPPKQYSMGLELIRLALFLGMGYLAFILTNIVAAIAVYFVYHFYRLQGRRSAPRRMRHFMDHMLFLRVYIAWFVTSIVLLIGSYMLYPLGQGEAAIPLQELVGGGKRKEKSQVEIQDVANAMEGLALVEYFKQYGAGHSLQFFVNRLAASLFVFCALLLIEKIIIQKITSLFHHRSLSSRIEATAFGVKAIKHLRELILQRQPELTGADIATILFSGLCPTQRSVVTIADIAAYLPPADAERLFLMMDTESMGELNLVQLRRAVSNMLEEQENLHLATLDQAQVIGKLDRIFVIFTTFVASIAWLALFQVSLQTVLVTLTGIAGFVLIISTSTIKTAFESVVFIIFTHPFDVGDKVMISQKDYTVRELGLWTTTFVDSANQVTYIANSKLRNEMIVNTRRSPSQSELIRISVLPSTTREQLGTLEAKLLEFLKLNSRDYIPRMAISGFAILDRDNLQIDIPLTHRSNFQDGALKAFRSTAFILYLKEALIECGISISPQHWGPSIAK